MADTPKLREPEEPINRTFVPLAQTNKQDFRSTGSSPIELVRFRQSVSAETPSGTRHYPSISLPNGMFAACDQQVPARAATLDTGGAFLAASRKADRYQPETGL